MHFQGRQLWQIWFCYEKGLLCKERISPEGEQILFLQSRPFSEGVVCRKAVKKSQNLSPLWKKWQHLQVYRTSLNCQIIWCPIQILRNSEVLNKCRCYQTGFVSQIEIAAITKDIIDCSFPEGNENNIGVNLWTRCIVGYISCARMNSNNVIGR